MNRSPEEKSVFLETGDGSVHAFKEMVLDFTGTLSLDGILLSGVAERLVSLAECIRITVVTADTFGKAVDQLMGLPVSLLKVSSGDEKAVFMAGIGPESTIAIGNGRNDLKMMKMAGLSIAVMGPEGVCASLLNAADVVVTNICQGLDLILNPIRLKATLRR